MNIQMQVNQKKKASIAPRNVLNDQSSTGTSQTPGYAPTMGGGAPRDIIRVE
jgi:hypothetical protein